MIHVDELRRWPGWPWPSCHLWDDTLIELELFARQPGLKAGWIQRDRHGAHYDLSPSKRALAVRLGARQDGVAWFRARVLAARRTKP